MNTPLFLIILAMMMVGGTTLESGSTNVTLPSPDTNINKIGLHGPGLGLIVACAIGSVVCLLIVWNRIHWRIRLSGGLGYDDWAICIALVRLYVGLPTFRGTNVPHSSSSLFNPSSHLGRSPMAMAQNRFGLSAPTLREP